MGEIDTSNIIESGRTRGKRVDYTKEVDTVPEGEDDDDEDFEEPQQQISYHQPRDRIAPTMEVKVLENEKNSPLTLDLAWFTWCSKNRFVPRFCAGRCALLRVALYT